LRFLPPMNLLILLFAASAFAGSNPCEGISGNQTITSEERFYRIELSCEDGSPQLSVRYFKDSGTVSQRLTFANGKVAEARVFSNKGEFTALSRFDYMANGNVVRTSFIVEKGLEGGVKSREELANFDPSSSEVQIGAQTVRKWFFDDQKTEFIAHYQPGDKRIIAKEYLNASGKTESIIFFSYRGEEEKPYRFIERKGSIKGKIISSLTLYEPFRPELSLRRIGLTRAEIKRRLDHQKNPNRFLLGVIDGGFDYNHPELAWKWWNNPSDPVDGKDNDGNGWVDDQFGWDRESNSHLPAESSTSMASYTRPDSHGTHVAHIATRDLEGVALIGFGGDYTRAAYINQISAFLKRHKVKVVNISIGLPKDNKDDFGLRDGIRAHERMVRENPETLFVVAAGNEGADIDVFANKQYPASFDAPNVMKVGSLDTNRLDPAKWKDYVISPWSNIGKRSVDILAPGADISAARLGGGYVVHSGTSMASPYMAREAARLWMKFPSLHAAQVREIFIRSARVMDPRPEIVSGGMVDFEAAEKLARETAK
jgi:subtilisin family serine protease